MAMLNQIYLSFNRNRKINHKIRSQKHEFITLLKKHSRKPNASTVATIWFLISRSFAATVPLLLSLGFSLPWRMKTTHFESFLVAVILLPQFSRWPRRKRAASRVAEFYFPAFQWRLNCLVFSPPRASLLSCPPLPCYISVICFREEGVIFFPLSSQRSKEAK